MAKGMTNSQVSMIKDAPKMKLNPKPYNLAERTMQYALLSREFLKRYPKNSLSSTDCRQLWKSTGSVGANSLEATEAVSRDDFIYRIKICRKEARESAYWFSLLKPTTPSVLEPERVSLFEESNELVKIFQAIINKTTNHTKQSHQY